MRIYSKIKYNQKPHQSVKHIEIRLLHERYLTNGSTGEVVIGFSMQ